MTEGRTGIRWGIFEALEWIAYRDLGRLTAGGIGGKRFASTFGPGGAYAALLFDMRAAVNWPDVIDSHPWDSLRGSLSVGEVIMLGRHGGSGRLEPVPAEEWLYLDLTDVTPLTSVHGEDYVVQARGSLDVNNFWSSLSIGRDELMQLCAAHPPKEAVMGAADEAEIKKTKRPPPARIDYSISDGPLVEQIRLAMKTGAGKSPYDVALSLADKAEGVGCASSKAKRLLGRYKQSSIPAE